MSTELMDAPRVELVDSPIVFSVTDGAIAEMAAAYLPLKVSSPDDRAGFAAVYEARQVVKKKRVEVENRRKELKAESLEFGRKVDNEAKRITSLLSPIEQHLQEQEDIVNREKERLKALAAEEAKRKLQARVDALAAVGASENLAVLAEMTDKHFADTLEAATSAHAAAQKRLAEERAKAEADRLVREEEARKLAAERAELDRQRAEQRAAQEKIDAENRRLAEADAAAKRAAEIEQARKEAAERAVAEQKAEAERQAAADAARKEAERLAEARRVAMQPDRDKLLAVAGAVAAVVVPVCGPEMKATETAVAKIVAKAAADIRKAVTSATEA